MMLNEKRKIKLAVVDDHNLFRKGLIKLITLADTESKYEVLFEAESGADLKEKLSAAQRPDIVLMDIDMPGLDGYQSVEWLNRFHPDIAILVISMVDKEEGVLRMLRMGIRGYLSKDIEVEDINRALEAISNKGYFYADFVSGIISQQIQGEVKSAPGNAMASKPVFSETELMLIGLACTELTYVEIADKMHVSPKTVDGYRDALFRRLGLKSRVGLAMYAVQHGLAKL